MGWSEKREVEWSGKDGVGQRVVEYLGKLGTESEMQCGGVDWTELELHPVDSR